MLILARKVTESIMIGDDIHIKVLGIQELTVLLGISAPKNIPVHRKEVYHHLQNSMLMNFIKREEKNDANK